MASTAARRLVFISMAGGVVAAMVFGCNGQGGYVIPKPEPPNIHGFQISKSFQREAQGGGFVTVDVAVNPGALPSWSSPPASPKTIGWFSNRGEGGKREKRYGFKPNRDTVYELEISNDLSPRTKWTMYEVSGVSRLPYRSGHLWACDDSTHGAVGRDIDFRDCTAPVTYSPAELVSAARQSRYFLAIYVRPDHDALALLSPAAWISCTTGCCSLGT
jgi:hypothetical protein